MQLQQRCRYFGGDRTMQCGVEDVQLVLTAYQQQDESCMHDGLHAHGQSLGGHFFLRSKQTGVCFDSAFGQFGNIGGFFISSTGFIETDVTVVADAQYLQVDTACFFDGLFIQFAFCLGVCSRAIWYVGIALAKSYSFPVQQSHDALGLIM